MKQRLAAAAALAAVALAFVATARAQAAPAPASFAAASNVGLNGGTTPADVEVADLNRDGIPDLVTADFNSNDLSLLRGNGNGTFGTATHLSVAAIAPNSVAAADLNGDGLLDLVSANRVSHNVSVLFQQGDGSFTSATTFGLNGGQVPSDVVAADVNGDHVPDLITANLNTNNVSVLLGDGHGGFGTATNFATGSGPV